METCAVEDVSVANVPSPNRTVLPLNIYHVRQSSISVLDSYNDDSLLLALGILLFFALLLLLLNIWLLLK